MDQKAIQRTELYQHLLSSYNLDKDDIPRLMEDIIGYFDLTLEEYVQLRHRQMQRMGLKNVQIYKRLLQEVEVRRFKAPVLSLRQVRRLIYG